MKRIIGLGFLMVFSTATYATDYFDHLWNKVEEKSFALKAATESHKASVEELKKANRHWLPQVYLGGATFFTDDAGTNMFGLLSQRAITNSDFMPTSLNDPGMNHFSKLTLGVELPLYEGNAGNGYQKVSEKMANAEKLKTEATKAFIHSEFFKLFLGVKTYLQHEKSFAKNNGDLKKLEKSYQLGSKENLLGYSGKLGMKNLGLKIESLIDAVQTKKNAQIQALEELTEENINLGLLDSLDVNAKYQSLMSYGSLNQKYSTDSIGEMAQARDASIDLNKARLRPQVALFADQTLFKGSRELSDAKTIGISLKWNLFSKESFTTDTKAIYESYAAKNAHLATQQNDKIEFKTLVEFEKVLENSLKKLVESKKITEEQVSITTRLFKNGIINILQLLEVLNQEVLLNENILELEEKLIDVRSKKIMFYKNI